MAAFTIDEPTETRRGTLARLGLTVGDRDPLFDELMAIAAAACAAPCAFLLLDLGGEGGVVGSEHGLPQALGSIPADELAPLQRGAGQLAFPDLALEPAFAGGAMVRGGLRFLAVERVHAPIDGAPIACLCVADLDPCEPDPARLGVLSMLARQIEHHLVARLMLQAHVETLNSLETSRAGLRGVLDASRNFIGVMAPDGVVLDANGTALHAAGAKVHEVVGRHFWDTVWWRHSPELQEQLRQAVATAAGGRKVAFEATHPAADGSMLHVDFTLTPVFNARGEVIQLVPEGVDVTERLQHMQRLAAANERLEQFVRIASHDLRAPLRGIAQLVGWLREEDGQRLSSPGLGYLDVIGSRVLRLDRMLQDLLEYERVDHRSHAATAPVDTRALVRDVVELLAPPRAFRVSIGEDLPTLETCEAPLRQVFLNLIANALKYHDRRDGTIRIELRGRDDERVTFAVVDDGPGIEPCYHERIFAMFEKLQSRDAVEGSGVGLALVRKTVRAFGGDVEVDSDIGRGATFSFSWPSARSRG